MKKTIVIAWAESEMIWDGESFAADLGKAPKFVEVVKPKAMVWLLEGNEEDLQKAQDYASGNVPGSKVFAYATSEVKPLERARREILAD
jgi:hypothetical protein